MGRKGRDQSKPNRRSYLRKPESGKPLKPSSTEKPCEGTRRRLLIYPLLMPEEEGARNPENQQGAGEEGSSIPPLHIGPAEEMWGAKGICNAVKRKKGGRRARIRYRVKEISVESVKEMWVRAVRWGKGGPIHKECIPRGVLSEHRKQKGGRGPTKHNRLCGPQTISSQTIEEKLLPDQKVRCGKRSGRIPR